MPRRATPESRERILTAATKVAQADGVSGLTVEAVAREAGCAKGLVHYHFRTKRELMDALARRFVERRSSSWVAALSGDAPEKAINRGWRLLTDESGQGVAQMWATLCSGGGELPDQAVREIVAQFAGSLGEVVTRTMAGAGLRPTVPTSEIGWLLAAVVTGLSLELAAGAKRTEIEGAWAAAWLGILSLYTQ